uniref:Uncharacterized protein n=1 Tax=Cucumis sativus TaxID=3659 RepID=A0A0A0KU91_CUCSA
MKIAPPLPLLANERRSAHAHRVTVLTVVRRSATVCGHVATLHGQTVVAGTVAGRSAIVGTIAEEVVTFRPLTFWPMKRRRLDPCLMMLNFKALQSLQNQNRSVGSPAVHVVVHFLLVSNGFFVGVFIVPNGGVRILLVISGVVVRVLLVANGIHAHVHLVGHAAAVVIVIFAIVAIFVLAVAFDLAVIFTLLVIFAVVKWTSSQKGHRHLIFYTNPLGV